MSSKAYDKGCEKGCEEGSRFPLVGKRRTEAHYVKHNESREKREGDGRGSVAESAKRARTHGERETSARSAAVVDSERENRMRIRGRSRECRSRRLSARTNERGTLGVNSSLVEVEGCAETIAGTWGIKTYRRDLSQALEG